MTSKARRAAFCHATMFVMFACLGDVATADTKHGEALFQTCAACHQVLLGDGLGPDLRKVLGRKAGSLPGFQYSEAMKTSGVIWDETTLSAFIRDPQAEVPGTLMAFPGYQNPLDAKDVVDYLKTIK
ncbi:c-type cytochrome [Bradyrhizobium mercantei]|uniref:c-type cytochrome n=1 Tax=Bradyrhizobium mercantei TaxID=1904807 RepID=UPI00117748AB|nr:c-type cytochrome [Bradyrhizobium mercantei]